MIEHFKCALDRGEYIACISMDISKAFDCLPHCLTICKLHAHGLSRDACTLIASYLYQRKQRVKIGNVKSEWQEISKDVPQGSILGPLIFNIFMNDLFYFVKRGHLFNYADNNSVSVNSKELNIVSQLLQSEAEVTVRWFCSNAMEANPSKFQGILFKGNKQASDFKISVGGHNIEFSKSMTTLGICIDKNLNFDLHIKDICLKASRQISALQRMTGLLDLASRKAIYTSFISSNFNSCQLVWFFTSRASIDKIQKLQERALRFVLKDSISDYETLLSKSDFDSFRISSVKTMAVEIYNILNGMSPEYLSTLFSKSNVLYQLRDGNKLTQPLKRTTTFGIKYLAYFGTHPWNMLPHHIKNSVSLREFKSMIGKWSGPTCHCCVRTWVVWYHSVLVFYYRFIAHCLFNIFTESIYNITLLLKFLSKFRLENSLSYICIYLIIIIYSISELYNVSLFIDIFIAFWWYVFLLVLFHIAYGLFPYYWCYFS